MCRSVRRAICARIAAGRVLRTPTWTARTNVGLACGRLNEHRWSHVAACGAQGSERPIARSSNSGHCGPGVRFVHANPHEQAGRCAEASHGPDGCVDRHDVGNHTGEERSDGEPAVAPEAIDAD